MPSPYIRSTFRFFTTPSIDGPYYPIISIRGERSSSPAEILSRDILLTGRDVMQSSSAYAHKCRHPFGTWPLPGISFTCHCFRANNDSHMQTMERFSDSCALTAVSKKKAYAKELSNYILSRLIESEIPCPILFTALYFHFRRCNGVVDITAQTD